MKNKFSKIITVSLALLVLVFLFAIRTFAEEKEPVSLSVSLKEGELYAYETIDSDLLCALILYSDGSTEQISPDALKIEYPCGDSLRAADESVLITYLDFSVPLSITVLKRDYDMSGAYWTDTELIYDKEAHTPTLMGLPNGVDVLEYAVQNVSDAGLYTLSASFFYDAENYNPPVCPQGTLKIERRGIEAPSISALVYNGCEQMPELDGSEIYSAEILAARDVGSYPVTLKITDKNYSFFGKDELTVYYEILPREIEIEIFDVDTYFFERDFDFSYKILNGELVEGEELSLSFEIYGQSIFASSLNKNYLLVYSPGTVTHHNGFSEGGAALLFIIILFLFTLVLCAVALFLSRYRIRGALLGYMLSKGKSVDALVQGPTPPQQGYTDGLAITLERADGLISDSLAKSLIKESKIVYTGGSRRAVINVDTLSESFKAGERVDVNKLKEKGLVPYDVAYLKILARGAIDKALFVYANDFSRAAVKMIALSGGESHRAITKKIKNG